MAITYESGNVGDNATDANATSMNITIGGTLTSSDVFFAVLTGWSTSSDFTSITQTNVTWTYLTDWVNSTNNCEIELWVGFATGTPGTTVTVYNNVSCFLVGTISRWQGFVSQPNMIRGVYTGVGNLPSSFPENTNQTVVTGISCNAGDALLACLWWDYSAPMASSLSSALGGTYYSQTFVGWSPSGQTDQGWAAEVATSAVSNFSIRMEDINGAITGSPPYFGIVFILKGSLGGDSYNQTFSDPLPITETIAKSTARSSLSDPFTSVFSDTFVQHRVLPGESFTETFSFQDLGIVRNPAKLPKDPFTITESFLATQTINAKAFSDPFILVESISKAISRSTFLDAYTMVESFTSSLNAPAVGAISIVQGWTSGGSGIASGSGFTIPAMSPGQTLIIFAAANSANGFQSGYPTCTNMTFYAGPVSTSESGLYHAWVTAGQPTGTTGTSVTFNFGSQVDFVLQFLIISGAATGNPFDSVTSFNYSSSAVGTASVSAAQPTNANELEMFIVASATTASTVGLMWGNGGHVAFNGQSMNFCGIMDYTINSGNPGSHTDSFTYTPTSSFIGLVAYVMPTVTPFHVPLALSDQFSVSDQVAKTTARSFAGETGIYSVFADVFAKNHGHVSPTLSDSFTSVFADVFSKKPGKLPVDPFAVVESFSPAHTHAPGSFSDPFTLLDTIQKATARGVVADQFSLLEPTFSTTHGYFPPAPTDTFSLADVFATLQLHFLNESDTFALSDISSLTHNQTPNFSDTINLSDIFGKSHAQFASLADALNLLETISTVRAYHESFLDTITILEAFFKTTGGGGVLLVYATGALLGSSAASAFLAAWVHAAATGHGYAAARVSISFLIAAMLKGASLLAGLAGQEFTDTGAASGGSTATGVEGAHLVAATGSTEGGSSSSSASQLWTAPTGEADGVSPELDCNAECIFQAEGTTMPDVPGAAVAVATYAMLRLVAALRGSSFARARVFSPAVVTGACLGGSTAEYVSIAIYGAEEVQGCSQALGAAGALFHADGECRPLAASSAAGTGNYRPGHLAGVGAGRSRATAVAN